MNHTNRWIATVVVATGLGIAGCGEADAVPDYARAFDNRPDRAKLHENAERAEQLREAAADDAEAAREDTLATLTTVRAPLRSDLHLTCVEAGQALDGYALARLSDDAEALGRWNATKEPDIQRFVDDCVDTGEIAVAACLKQALRDAPVRTFGPADSTDIVDRCHERWRKPQLTARLR
jgi:hypothetical protein